MWARVGRGVGRRVGRRAGTVVVAAAAAFVVTGAGTHHPVTAGPENVAAAQAVAALTTPGTAQTAAILPRDFAEVVGYRPAVVTDADGSAHLVKPSGECSWIGATSYDFGRACKTHDLGYDLLRYATASGGELGPWARRAIDGQLGEELRARCDAIEGGPSCDALAGVTSSAVEANSWRQGQGNPGAERLGPYLVGGALIAAAVAGPSLAAALRRVRRMRAAAASARHVAVVK